MKRIATLFIILLLLPLVCFAQSRPWDHEIRHATNTAALRLLNPPVGDTKLMTTYVLGSINPGDGGGGYFLWNGSETASDDGGICISPTGRSTAGRWVRLLDGDRRINVRWYGAQGDNLTDDYTAFMAAMYTTYVPWGTVYAPTGIYRLSHTVTLATGVRSLANDEASPIMKNLVGDGRNQTWLVNTATSAPYGPALAIYGNNFKVSDLGIITANSNCDGILVDGRGDGNKVGASAGTLRNLYLATFGHGIVLKNIWGLDIKNVVDNGPFSGHDLWEVAGLYGIVPIGVPDIQDILGVTRGYGEQPGKNFINAELLSGYEYATATQWLNALTIEYCKASGYDWKVSLVASDSAVGINCNNITIRNNTFQSGRSTIRLMASGTVWSNIEVTSNYLGEGEASGPMLMMRSCRDVDIGTNETWESTSLLPRLTRATIYLEDCFATIHDQTVQDLVIYGDGSRVTLNNVTLWTLEIDPIFPNARRNLRGTNVNFDGFPGKSYLNINHNGNWIANYGVSSSHGFPYVRAGDRTYLDPSIASSSGFGTYVITAPSIPGVPLGRGASYTTVISPGYAVGTDPQVLSVFDFYKEIATTTVYYGWIVCTKGGAVGVAEVKQYTQSAADATWTQELAGYEFANGTYDARVVDSRTMWGQAFSFRFNSDAVLATGDAWISTFTPQIRNSLTGP